MRDVYAPAIEGAPDTVGRERYARWSRYFNGTDLDLDEAYAYGWSEYHRLLAEMQHRGREDPARAPRPLGGAGPPRRARQAHRGRRGGPGLAPGADGRGHRRSWTAPTSNSPSGCGRWSRGSPRPAARRPRTTPSRRWTSPVPAAPGCRRWARPASRSYDLVSTWYHEGVPGHHLQLAQWAHVADQLSRYQATVGMVSANAEGWALYAERLMDELGFLTDAERRLGYLDAQMMRAARVIVDIGMHLELEIPADSPFHPGERWTPELAQEFFGAHSGRPADFVESELTRYLAHARPGDRLQARRAGLAAGPGGGPRGGTATPSTARRGTWRRCRRGRWAWTTWWPSCPRSDALPSSSTAPRNRPVTCRLRRVSAHRPRRSRRDSSSVSGSSVVATRAVRRP